MVGTESSAVLVIQLSTSNFSVSYYRDTPGRRLRQKSSIYS